MITIDHDHDHDDGEYGSMPEIEAEDDTLQGVDLHAKGFLDVWSSLGGGIFEGSEGGDRDSGIEVDKMSHTSAPLGDGGYRVAHADNGRPPESENWGQRR
jgi:hypothetical protein